MPILVTCECGKQFQAKDENVGRRFNCPNCGREVVVPKPDADAYYDPPIFEGTPPRTSGKAIASLVLGILSFFCNIFTGIPAIILGAIGLANINASKGRLTGKGLAISGIVTGSLSLVAIPIMIALLLPAVQAAREAARRAQCVNNLKQIGLAFHNSHEAEGKFPAAAITAADGKPLLSWRVKILPYLGEQALYNQFKLDEPWDSPSNKPLLAQMPLAYRCPSDPQVGATTTRYQAIVGPGTIFEGPDGMPLAKITDGTSNTILAVEASTPVEWTKPDDLDIGGLVGGIGGLHPGVANVLFADGAVRSIRPATTPASILKALSTSSGGEILAPGSY